MGPSGMRRTIAWNPGLQLMTCGGEPVYGLSFDLTAPSDQMIQGLQQAAKHIATFQQEICEKRQKIQSDKTINRRERRKRLSLLRRGK